MATHRRHPELSLAGEDGLDTGMAILRSAFPAVHAAISRRPNGEADEHDTGEATIRMGDAGWRDAYRVRDGHAEGLLLGEAEAMWLRAWRPRPRRRSRPA